MADQEVELRKAALLKGASGKASREAVDATAREELFLEKFKRVLQVQAPIKIKAYKPRKNRDTERVVNIMCSDTHYGADLKKHETGSKYGPIEEARRTAAVAL